MWRRNGICVVLTTLLLGASSDDHCIGGESSTNHIPGAALIQRSLASGLSKQGISKLVEQKTKTSASGIASTLVSELEVGTQRFVQDPEGELSTTNKRAFVALSAFILVGVGCWTSKMINDYEAASTISSLPWYTDSQMLLQISFLMLSTWFALGLTAFTQVILFNDPPRHLTLIETFYLSSQIVTTVGYGDLTPSRPEGQVFVACYILVGVSLVAVLLGELLDRAVSKSSGSGALLEKRGEGSEDAEKHPSAKSTKSTKARGPTSSQVSFVKAIAGYHQDQIRHPMFALARSVVIFLIATVAGTLFFCFYPGEDKSIWLAFYMSCVTLTSVGFGATHPVTQGGYLFATFWMIIGVSCTANLICQLQDVLMKQRKVLTSALVKDQLLKAMDEDGSGTVGKIEFLTFELVRKGICQAHEIHTVLALFEHLDTDGSGELNVEDIRLLAAEGAVLSH